MSDEILGALDNLSANKVDAVVVLMTNPLLQPSDKLAAMALERRLPTICGYREHVLVGSLISYGVDLRWCFYRGAYFVDRILRGIPPGELPIEFPTQMFLAINLKTAKALGITIEPMLLARADEVLE